MIIFLKIETHKLNMRISEKIWDAKILVRMLMIINSKIISTFLYKYLGKILSKLTLYLNYI